MNRALIILMALVSGSSIPVFSSSSALATIIVYMKKKKIQEIVRALAGGLLAITILYISSSGLHLIIENLVSRSIEIYLIVILAASMLLYGLGVAGIFGYPWYKTLPRSVCKIIEKEPYGSSTLLGFILYFRPTISGTIAIMISIITNDPLQSICYFTALYIGITISMIISCYYASRNIKSPEEYGDFIDKLRKNTGFIIATAGFIGLLSIF